MFRRRHEQRLERRQTTASACAAGVKVFKRDKDAPGVAYYTELTREDLLRSTGTATKKDKGKTRK